jgi:CheY-like chemotaxis protein
MLNVDPIALASPAIRFMAASPTSGSDDDEGSEVGSGRALPVRVLVVEDEILIAVDIRATLIASGYAVVGIAATADQAVAAATKERPDVVLRDIRLAGARDGIDAAREIRERLDIPSLFVTANADEGTRRRAEATAPIGFLHKPFDAPALREALSVFKK